jgi:hypothetical protein
VQANVFPFTFNVTLAVPVPFAVTLPLAFTTATFVLLLDQVIPLLCPVNIKGAETCGIHGIVFRSYEQAKKELDEFLKEF